jgi:hypothetical protein
VQPQSTHSCQLVLLAGEITHIGSNHAEWGSLNFPL